MTYIDIAFVSWVFIFTTHIKNTVAFIFISPLGE